MGPKVRQVPNDSGTVGDELNPLGCWVQGTQQAVLSRGSLFRGRIFAAGQITFVSLPNE